MNHSETKGSSAKTTVHYFDAFEWRWACEPDKWHTSFVVDMTQDGKRYVLLKCGCVYCHGVTGDKCDKALEAFKAKFKESFEKEYADETRRLILGEKEIEIPAMQELDGELWDVERSAYHGPTPVAVSEKVLFPYKGKTSHAEAKESSPKKKPTPTEKTPKKAVSEPSVASLSDMELAWFAKMAENKGDTAYLDALRQEQQRRFEAIKHLSVSWHENK